MTQECLYRRPERLLHEDVKVKPETTSRPNVLDTEPWDFCQGELYIGERNSPRKKTVLQAAKVEGPSHLRPITLGTDLEFMLMGFNPLLVQYSSPCLYSSLSQLQCKYRVIVYWKYEISFLVLQGLQLSDYLKYWKRFCTLKLCSDCERLCVQGHCKPHGNRRWSVRCEGWNLRECHIFKHWVMHSRN